MTRLVLAAGCLVTALSLAACGASGGGSGNSSSQSSATTSTSATAGPSGGSGGSSSTTATSSKLVIKGFAYSGHLTVKPGEKVSVVNDDGAPHTVTSKDNKFDSGTINGSGGTGTFTAPTQPGKYKFGCNFHPNMAGTLTVQG